MYCMQCGTKLPEDARFCFSCGVTTKQQQVAKEEPVEPRNNSGKEGSTITESLPSSAKKTSSPFLSPEFQAKMKNLHNSPLKSKFKDKAYEEIAQVMLDGLDSAAITVEESYDISEFVLNRLDACQTPNDLFPFLTELMKKWPIYETVSIKLMGEIYSDMGACVQLVHT